MRPSVGETLVHPQHGTTVVTGYETRVVRGEEVHYLVLRREEDELTVRIPTEITDDSGLRTVIDEADTSDVFDVLESEPIENPGSWRKQHARNERRVNSGDVEEIARALRDLQDRLDTRGTLSPTDRALYREARERLVEELAAATGDDPETIEARVDESIGAVEDDD